MDIKIDRAIKQFFPSPSFQMVLFEAIANALDAQATIINISISIDKLSAHQTLIMDIEDNGIGIDDTRFEQFKSLLETDDTEHRGLGRLVYLYYFSQVDILSYFGKRQRKICFNRDFKDQDNVEDIAQEKRGTKLSFSGYRLKKINDQKYLTPKDLSQQIINEFLSKLFVFKQEGKDFKITISLSTNEGKDNPLKNGFAEINKDTLPKLTEEKLPDINLFSNNRILYQIEQVTNGEKARQLFAYNIDGRSFPIDIFHDLKLPDDYNVIFILTSDWLKGKTDSSRTSLELKSDDRKALEEIVIKCVSTHINEMLPEIKKHNENVKERLNKKFPHLEGYFSEAGLGLVEESRSLDEAQQRFFKAQKEILGADSLTSEQYDVAMGQASRVLMEYILYRNFTIQRIKNLDPASKEADINNIIAPMKTVLRAGNFASDMYIANAWLLDDKFMNYSCVLSDKDLKDLLSELTIDNETADSLRPDIAIVFSKDVNKHSAGVDVVIVELKRKNNKLLDDIVIIEQLKQRARRLVKYYGTKIQRIWFFGLVGFTDEFRQSIEEDEWTRLYSTGDL